MRSNLLHSKVLNCLSEASHTIMTDLFWKGPIVNTQSVVSGVDFARSTSIQEDRRKDENLVDKCGDNSGASTIPDVSTQSSKGTWWS